MSEYEKYINKIQNYNEVSLSTKIKAKLERRFGKKNNPKNNKTINAENIYNMIYPLILFLVKLNNKTIDLKLRTIIRTYNNFSFLMKKTYPEFADLRLNNYFFEKSKLGKYMSKEEEEMFVNVAYIINLNKTKNSKDLLQSLKQQNMVSNYRNVYLNTLQSFIHVLQNKFGLSIKSFKNMLSTFTMDRSFFNKLYHKTGGQFSRAMNKKNDFLNQKNESGEERKINLLNMIKITGGGLYNANYDDEFFNQAKLSDEQKNVLIKNLDLFINDLKGTTNKIINDIKPIIKKISSIQERKHAFEMTMKNPYVQEFIELISNDKAVKSFLSRNISRNKGFSKIEFGETKLKTGGRETEAIQRLITIKPKVIDAIRENYIDKNKLDVAQIKIDKFLTVFLADYKTHYPEKAIKINYFYESLKISSKNKNVYIF